MKGWKSLCKSWGVFGTQASIYEAFFVKIVNNLFFSQKNFIIDARLGSKEASKTNEILKTKLKWSKSSWLLQRLAFVVLL